MDEGWILKTVSKEESDFHLTQFPKMYDVDKNIGTNFPSKGLLQNYFFEQGNEIE